MLSTLVMASRGSVVDSDTLSFMYQRRITNEPAQCTSSNTYTSPSTHLDASPERNEIFRNVASSFADLTDEIADPIFASGVKAER